MPCLRSVRGGCTELGSRQDAAGRRCQNTWQAQVGPTHSRLLGRSPVERRKNRLVPRPFFLLCLPQHSESRAGLKPGRASQEEMALVGAKRNARKIDQKMASMLGGVRQRRWGGLGRWSPSLGLGAETQPDCDKGAAPRGTPTGPVDRVGLL